MRAKLIEILSQDKAYPDCKNCKTPVGHCNRCVLEFHADHLIASGVTVLPCKIGDTVWAIKNHGGVLYIKQGKVSEMAYLEDMRLAIAVKFESRYSTRGFWGKDIFATYEECVAEVERRAEHG